AFRERSFEPEQAGHCVLVAVGIFEPAPQHHVAATLAVDGNGAAGKLMHTSSEPVGGRQGAGMEFRIAAGQPDGISRRIGCLTRQWRERNDFRASQPPSLYRAQPSATAAAVSVCPVTSSTSTTGQPRRAARSAVAPVPHCPRAAAPSNNPITPSAMEISAPAEALVARFAISPSPIAQ